MGTKQEFASYFREIQGNFSRFYATVLAKVGLTLPQYAFLSQLMATGTIPMTEASRKLHISKPAVTNLVDRLEKSNYLARIPHPNDRRVYLLKLLPKGIRIVRKVQEAVLKILLKTLDRFSERKRATIIYFYRSLAATLEKTLDQGRAK